jgi:hypothetical protein
MIELLAFLVGVACGAVGYRYTLKRRPDLIERLAEQARALRDR